MPAKCVSEISKRNVNSIHSSERSSKLEGLMARVQEGDAEAFKEVIKELWPKVWALCSKIVGPDGADDVAQETFTKVWRYRDRYKSSCPLEPWVMKIARNCALDHKRKEKRRKESAAPPDMLQNAVEQLDKLGLSISELKLWTDVEDCLGRLEHEEFDMIWLYYIEGYTLKEIGIKANKSHTTTRRRLERAVKKLRECLREKGYNV